MTIRKREKIIIASALDTEFKSERQSLNYDSVRHYYHNGYLRAEIDIISPNHPLNGMSGQSKSGTITHKLRLFKSRNYESGEYALWLDGTMPRLLRIEKIMQDKKSRRHVLLYCVEKQIGDAFTENEYKSTFGSQINTSPVSY